MASSSSASAQRPQGEWSQLQAIKGVLQHADSLSSLPPRELIKNAVRAEVSIQIAQETHRVAKWEYLQLEREDETRNAELEIVLHQLQTLQAEFQHVHDAVSELLGEFVALEAEKSQLLGSSGDSTGSSTVSQAAPYGSPSLLLDAKKKSKGLLKGQLPELRKPVEMDAGDAHNPEHDHGTSVSPSSRMSGLLQDLEFQKAELEEYLLSEKQAHEEKISSVQILQKKVDMLRQLDMRLMRDIQARLQKASSRLEECQSFSQFTASLGERKIKSLRDLLQKVRSLNERVREAEEELEINVLKFHENQQVIHVERREVESKLYDEFNAHKQVAKMEGQEMLMLVAGVREKNHGLLANALEEVKKKTLQSARKLNRDIGDAADELDEIRNREASIMSVLQTLQRHVEDLISGGEGAGLCGSVVQQLQQDVRAKYHTLKQALISLSEVESQLVRGELLLDLLQEFDSTVTEEKLRAQIQEVEFQITSEKSALEELREISAPAPSTPQIGGHQRTSSLSSSTLSDRAQKLRHALLDSLRGTCKIFTELDGPLGQAMDAEMRARLSELELKEFRLSKPFDTTRILRKGDKLTLAGSGPGCHLRFQLLWRGDERADLCCVLLDHFGKHIETVFFGNETGTGVYFVPDSDENISAVFVHLDELPAHVAHLYFVVFSLSDRDLSFCKSLTLRVMDSDKSQLIGSMWWGQPKSCTGGVFCGVHRVGRDFRLEVLKQRLKRVTTHFDVIPFLQEQSLSRGGMSPAFEDTEVSSTANAPSSLDQLEQIALQRMLDESILLDACIMCGSFTEADKGPQLSAIGAALLVDYLTTHSCFNSEHSMLPEKIVHAIAFMIHKSGDRPLVEIHFLSLLYHLLTLLKAESPSTSKAHGSSSSSSAHSGLLLEDLISDSRMKETYVPIHVGQDWRASEYLPLAREMLQNPQSSTLQQPLNSSGIERMARFRTTLMSLSQTAFIHILHGTWKDVRGPPLDAFFGDSGVEQIVGVVNKLDPISSALADYQLPETLHHSLIVQTCDNIQGYLVNSLFQKPEFRNPMTAINLQSCVEELERWANGALYPAKLPSDTFKIATQASLLLLAVPSQLTADQIRSEYPSLTRGQLDVLLPESQDFPSKKRDPVLSAGRNVMVVELPPPTFTISPSVTISPMLPPLHHDLIPSAVLNRPSLQHLVSKILQRP